MNKKLPVLRSKIYKFTKKNGRQNGKQRYKCLRRFDGGRRLDSQKILLLYTDGKQTARQLAQHYGCRRKTIRCYLQKSRLNSTFPIPAHANLLIDIACFDRSFAVLVLYNSTGQQALYVQAVRYVSNALYLQAIHCLASKRHSDTKHDL